MHLLMPLAVIIGAAAASVSKFSIVLQDNAVNSSKFGGVSFTRNGVVISKIERFADSSGDSAFPVTVEVRRDYRFEVKGGIEAGNVSLLLTDRQLLLLRDCQRVFTHNIPQDLLNTKDIPPGFHKNLTKRSFSSGLPQKLKRRLALDEALAQIGCSDENTKELLCVLNGECGEKTQEIAENEFKEKDRKLNEVFDKVSRMSDAFDRIMDEFYRLSPSEQDDQAKLSRTESLSTATTAKTHDTYSQYPRIGNCSADTHQYFEDLRFSREHTVANAFYIASTSANLIVVSQADSELLTLMRAGEIVGFRVLATKAGNIAHDSEGRFYIGDSARGWVAILDSNLRVIKYLARKFQKPLGIGLSDNLLYVAQSNKNYIQIVDSGGRVVRNFTASAEQISDVFVRGETVYVSGKRGIQRFDLKGHKFEDFWGGGFVRPKQIFVDEIDRLWAVDEYTKQLVVLSTYDGEVIDKLDLSEYSNSPNGFALDSSCNLYIADKTSGKVVVLKRNREKDD